MTLTQQAIQSLTSRRIGDVVTYPGSYRPARILDMVLDGDGALVYIIDTDLSATTPSNRLGQTAHVSADYIDGVSI